METRLNSCLKGDVKLHLHALSKPFGRSKDIKDWPLSEETNSLFEKVRVKGWWPVAGKPKKQDKKKNQNGEEKSDKFVLTVSIDKAVFQLRVFCTYVHARKSLNPF